MVDQIKWTGKFLSRVDSSVHLIYHDPSDPGSLILIRIILKETAFTKKTCLLFHDAAMLAESGLYDRLRVHAVSTPVCPIQMHLQGPFRQRVLTPQKQQWGTKVLTHFPKMAPFCIVDLLIPFPCLPQPLPPKINVEFWTLKSFFYFRQHWFGGSGDLRPLKGMK